MISLPRPVIMVVPGRRAGEVVLLSAQEPQLTTFDLLTRREEVITLPTLAQPAEVTVIR